MNGLKLEFLNRIFFVLGSHDREYWLGLGGKCHISIRKICIHMKNKNKK
jgi:hypothetical protein